MTERHEFKVGSDATLDAHVDSGRIDIRNGPAGLVVVTISGKHDDWQVDSAGDTVTIRPVRRLRTRSVRMLVEVPDGARIDVKTASASARLTGAFGETRLQSASGELVVGSPTAVRAETSSGDVRVADVVAEASLSTASGAVEIGRVGGRLTVTTSSGDVHAGHVVGDLRVGTTSGAVRIDRSDGSEIDVKSVSGDVLLGLPSGIRVEPDLSTLSGRTNLPAPASAVSSDDQRRIVRVTVKNVSGDITIERAK